MLSICIIGIGNTGGQVASLARETLGVPAIAINSSGKDLETISDNIPKKKISKEGMDSSQGAGKDRHLAKNYLKDSINALIVDDDITKMIDDANIVFIVSSTGGGTGSGTAPMMYDILTRRYADQMETRDLKFILVGVLPVDNEALDSHVNTFEYLNEIYKVLEKPTYMLYDNDKFAELPSYQILKKVNHEIVSDMNVLRCAYNFTTPFDSIDDKDMMRILRTSGRIVVARLENFSEKEATDKSTIEDMIIDNIKRNAHVETQRDKKIAASGIITNLSQALTSEFDDNIPTVRQFIGTPTHAFKHIYVNEERKDPNNVFLIMAGLTRINDKILLVNDRIEEIKELMRIQEEEDALSSVDMDELSQRIADEKTNIHEEKVDLNSIWGKFGV